MTYMIWRAEDVVRISGTSIDRPEMTVLGNGGYVATWRESENTIRFQVYDGHGAKVGGPQSVAAAMGSAQLTAAVQGYGTNGEFVITSVHTNGANNFAYVQQRFDAQGNSLGAPVTIASGTNVPSPTDTASVAMSHYSEGGWGTAFLQNNTVQVQAFQPDGTLAGSASITSPDTATGPDIAWLGGSKYLVSYMTNGTTLNLKMTDGFAVSEGTMTITGVEAADISGLKNASGNPSEAFVVVVDRGIAGGIHAYHYANPNATPTIIEISSAAKPSTGDFASVTALRNGGFAVAYIARPSTPDADARTDLGDVFVRVFDINGNAVGGPLRVNASAATDSIGAQTFPKISEMHDGRLAVTWLDPTVGHGFVASAIVDARTSAVALTGTGVNDVYAPSEYAGDNFNGGEGFDTLTFQAAGAGVAVDLWEGLGTAGIAADDIYTNFEKVIGSRFNDTLTGGNGASVLQGGAGNDTYIVKNAENVLVEAAGGGTDLVQTFVTYALGANLENLYALGTDAITLTGNTLSNKLVGNGAANTLYGNSGNDTLDGGAGADRMVGGTGNDIYYVDNIRDVVAETSSGGTSDLVYTKVSYTLSAYVEKLYATGSSAINLTGNSLANTIKGNAGANKINGGSG